MGAGCIGFVVGTALGDLYSGGNQGGRPRMFESEGSMPALVITIFATIGIVLLRKQDA